MDWVIQSADTEDQRAPALTQAQWPERRKTLLRIYPPCKNENVSVCVFIVVWLSQTQPVIWLVGPRIWSGLNYLNYYWMDYTIIMNHTHFNYPWLVLSPQRKVDILAFQFDVFTGFGLFALQFCTTRGVKGSKKVREHIKRQTDHYLFTFINQSIHINQPKSAGSDA